MSIKSIIRKKFLETNQYYIEEEELEEAMIGFGGVKPKGEFVMLAGGPGCFVSGTLVETKDGRRKIEELDKGDLVLTFNEKTKQEEYKEIEKVIEFSEHHENLLELVFENGEKIICTENHEFYVDGRWIRAKDLNLLLSKKIIGKVSTENKVYDLSVKDNHNFYITESKILVHNSGKGWVKDNIINQSADFKSFDVDELKKLMVKTIARKKVTGGKIPGFGDKKNWIEFKKQHQTDQLDVDNPEHRDYIIKTAGDMKIENPEVALKFFKDAKEGNYWVPPKDKKNPQEGEWDFKNASHVSLLHGIVASLGEKERFFDYMFKSQSGKDRENMDNVLADVTGGKIDENIKMLSRAKEAGFRTSLVFVLTDQETAWYNNISRDRKVAQNIFSKLHNTIPPNISKMLEEQSQYLDRAFIVFSTPRGDGTPILDLKVQIPSANWFLDAIAPKEGESEQDFNIRKDKAKDKFKKRENLIAALRAMANQQGLSVKELLKKVSFKGTHADTSGFEYGDIVELKKVGDSFELPNQIKKKMDEFSKEANYIEDPEKIPEFMQKFKGWEREIGL